MHANQPLTIDKAILSPSEIKLLSDKQSCSALEKIGEQLDALYLILLKRKGITNVDEPWVEYELDYYSYGFEFQKGDTVYWLGTYFTYSGSEACSPIILSTEEAQSDPEFTQFKNSRHEGFCYHFSNYTKTDELLLELESKLPKIHELKKQVHTIPQYDICLDAAEKAIIESKELAQALIKIFIIVNQVAHNMGELNDRGKPQFYEDDPYAGFEFENNDIAYWIGYWPKMATAFGSPFIIENYADDDEIGDNFKYYIDSEGNGDEGFFHPIQNCESPQSILTELKKFLGKK